MEKLQQLAESVINGKAPDAERLTQELLDEGLTPSEVLNQGLIIGMDEVGRRFRNNEFYVPEVLIAARAMKSGMKILRPLLAETGVKPMARIAIGTVKGDLHDIGKNLVGMMLEGAGFEVVDLGVDVSSDKFIQAVKENNAEAIGMSALLTTTMVNMDSTMKEIEKQGIRNQVKVIIGGAPVTQNYADEIGADGYASDAASAVALLKEVLNLPA
ncbi:methyltransferase [candidate division KSB1 bacterium 4484_87]|nr:MAG: methyltransferase [candidate division KSB1 bacterium 4484_87]